MVKKKKRNKKPANLPPPLWLLTFTDIVALMLTFFVLLYSMSEPEREKWDRFTSALTSGFSAFESARSFDGAQQEINIDRLDMKKALSLDYLETLLDEQIKKDGYLRDVMILHQGDQLILSLPSDLLFQSGRASVSSRGRRALFSIGGLLSRIRNRLEVVGHTDPALPDAAASKGFSTNWELSLMRAIEVGALLEEAGYTRAFIVRGMSSARYDELPSSMPEQERAGYARRVDIIVMQDDGHKRLMPQ